MALIHDASMPAISFFSPPSIAVCVYVVPDSAIWSCGEDRRVFCSEMAAIYAPTYRSSPKSPNSLRPTFDEDCSSEQRMRNFVAIKKTLRVTMQTLPLYTTSRRPLTPPRPVPSISRLISGKRIPISAIIVSRREQCTPWLVTSFSQ